MQPNPSNDLRKAYRISAFIGLTMITSLIAYAVVVELIKKQNAPFSGFAPLPDVIDTLRYALLSVVVVEFFMIRFLNKIMLSGKGQPQSSAATSPFAPNVSRLVAASIVTYALCESVAIYGLVLFFIQGNSNDFYLFVGLSILSFVVYFPRYDNWEEWVAEQEQARRPQP